MTEYPLDRSLLSFHMVVIEGKRLFKDRVNIHDWKVFVLLLSSIT